jgi:thiol-disulfide isomerase/thioredoxin
MRKIALAFILLFATAFSYAQTTNQIKLTQNSVVIDSSGMKYPYMIWQRMTQSGDYWLKPIDPQKEDTPLLLVKYTQEQKDEYYKTLPKPAASEFFTTGQAIKPFKVRDINGKKIDVKEWAGKTVVLNFWFIGCPPCRAEIPDLNKLAIKYKDNPNVLFIAMALDGDDEVKDFVKKNPLAYRVVGTGDDLAHQFKIHLYPTNVVIDKEGKVRFHYVGGYQNGPYWIDKTIQESEKGGL